MRRLAGMTENERWRLLARLAQADPGLVRRCLAAAPLRPLQDVASDWQLTPEAPAAAAQ